MGPLNDRGSLAFRGWRLVHAAGERHDSLVARHLTILILREGPLTVARSLEYDIVAQGDSIDEALAAWADVFAAQIILDVRAGREPLADVGPAPERYFELFKRAKRLETEPIRLPDEVPHPWMIAAMHPELRAY